MLELFSSGLVTVWLKMAGVTDPLPSIGLVTAGTETPWVVQPGNPEPDAQAIVRQYVQGLAGSGLSASEQGVWLQSPSGFLASNEGMTPLPAASLTKVATSLVALHTWGTDYQFETLVSTTGTIQNGVLNGDLIIHGSGDPLMVWEEAFALGNDLNRMGIRRVAGNLVITGNFLMNFETDPQKAGQLFKQALNQKTWNSEAAYQFQTLPKGTPKPQVTIDGAVQVLSYGTDLLPPQTPLVRHRSLPIAQILKLMNLYSNNVIAESLANSLGGARVVAQKAALTAGFPQQEIQLINGSGLGVQNQISPRAVCAMFAAVQRYLQPRNLTIADLFPIAGTDQGTIEGRRIPFTSVVKTGTLNDVSALAGAIPTRDHGLVWFTIINRGGDLDGLRNQQDRLLQTLTSQWGTAPARPTAVTPNGSSRLASAGIGDASRNKGVRSAVESNSLQQ